MIEENKIIQSIMSIVQHYNHKKYWKMRDYVVSNYGNRFLKYYYLGSIELITVISFCTHIRYGV